MVHKRVKSAKKVGMRGIHKYNYDGFSRATNKKGELVGYVGTLTWVEGEKLKEAKGDWKTFQVSMGIVEENEVVDFQTLTGRALNLEAFKTAMGYYSDYAREWGDYRGFIKAIDDKEPTIHEVKTKYKEVEY